MPPKGDETLLGLVPVLVDLCVRGLHPGNRPPGAHCGTMYISLGFVWIVVYVVVAVCWTNPSVFMDLPTYATVEERIFYVVTRWFR